MNFDSSFSFEDWEKLRRKVTGLDGAWDEPAPPQGWDPMCETRRLGVLCLVMRSHGWKARLQEFPRAFPGRNVRADVLRPDGTGAYAFGFTKQMAFKNLIELIADEVMAL